jgi:hypothetical protein
MEREGRRKLPEKRPRVDEREGRCKLELERFELIKVEDDSEVRASVDGGAVIETDVLFKSLSTSLMLPLAPVVSGGGIKELVDKEVAARMPPVMSQACEVWAEIWDWPACEAGSAGR